jgi:hypothetical protein
MYLITKYLDHTLKFVCFNVTTKYWNLQKAW